MAAATVEGRLERGEKIIIDIKIFADSPPPGQVMLALAWLQAV